MSNSSNPDILYTIVDEAPELASASLLPIVQSFAASAGINVGSKDISLAGRIKATFGKYLKDEQEQNDGLKELGEIVQSPKANVIKLPNISASVPQLVSAIKELQSQGFAVPDYPYEPSTEHEISVRKLYDTIKGSAVNPVLREGNSDRRAAKAVKKYAMANPHFMGKWRSSSATHVSSMDGNDFFDNEKSATIKESQAGFARIEFTDLEGNIKDLKTDIKLESGTVVDATFMSVADLRAFLLHEIKDAKKQDVLFSVHLKATMMKVSDPIIFGHVVSVFFKDVFKRHRKVLDELGVSPNSGLGEILERVSHDSKITQDFNAIIEKEADLYMVDSERGITNLHVPSDVIIDASMPALIRAGGIAWGPDGSTKDTKCVIPDNSYAPVYEETIKFFKEKGALEPSTSGTVANVGLMAQKAQEYGSHPTTFEIPRDGTVRYILENGTILHEHEVKSGDIWRSCSVNKAPIMDWINLAIERQVATDAQAIFWLDQNRAHDAQLIPIVEQVLNRKGIRDRFLIMSPRKATRVTLETITKGEDSIAVTGNVLRDYLTDLFPILELGTSAKMLSIVKLMNGGGLFETGAGGSAPKHVQQLQEENHLRWDSLGEFCALGESFNFLAANSENKKAATLGSAIETATQGILDNNKSPGRKLGETDNRHSHFFFALYWAKALAEQKEDYDLAIRFTSVYNMLKDNTTKILNELDSTQGLEVDLGGYYHPDKEKVAKIMRPSPTMNSIIDDMLPNIKFH
ncbi:MAG: NADP-dependent isocitrate dehydrogenase [Paracoccaceae bacterium]|uniref:NADP-dependent isocitrate dehydrogenase n=1 Tax=Candidatus Salinivivens marinus TaxID=3381703 RepID=UPI000BE06C06|nr:MAG: isocitrate dehydrogenase (NADP(+)) [Rhodobacteraceae bacterium MED-G08]